MAKWSIQWELPTWTIYSTQKGKKFKTTVMAKSYNEAVYNFSINKNIIKEEEISE